MSRIRTSNHTENATVFQKKHDSDDGKKSNIMKEKILKWYKMKLWTKEMVEKAAEKGVITISDVEEILKEV